MKRMTIAVMALVAIPALASAQDSTRQHLDSARTKMQAQDSASVRTGPTARGRRASRGSMGLSSDQVMQLQTALTNAGCDAGTADGVLGPKTRRAMTCARQKNNVTTNAELYRSLNLEFETSGTSGRQPSRGAHEASTETRATHGDSAAVGGRNRGRIRPPATDSARRDSTRRDSTSH